MKAKMPAPMTKNAGMPLIPAPRFDEVYEQGRANMDAEERPMSLKSLGSTPLHDGNRKEDEMEQGKEKPLTYWQSYRFWNREAIRKAQEEHKRLMLKETLEARDLDAALRMYLLRPTIAA